MQKNFLFLIIVISSFLFLKSAFGGLFDKWDTCCSSGCDYSPGQELTLGQSKYCCTPTGWVAGSCECVVYTQKEACEANSNCAWCNGDNKCKDKASVVCQPPSCSVDKKSECTSTCTWKDCENNDNSCYCDASQGKCVACSAPTPHCSNYQCTQCADYCDGANRCGGSEGDTRYYNVIFSGGTCVAQSSENCKCDAEDTDGISYSQQGTCTDYEGCSGALCKKSQYTDYCLDSTTLREYYVSGLGDSATCTYTDKNCKEIDSSYVCASGKCGPGGGGPGQCSGSVSLSISPSTATPGQSVTPSASGLSNCDGKTVNFRQNSCSGIQVSSCSVSGGGCSGSSFNAPNTEGIYVYFACIDKNNDGDYGDSGESDSETLNVSSGASFDWTVSISPAEFTVHAGECELGEITSTLLSGTTRDVDHFCNMMPADAYCTYYPPGPTCKPTCSFGVDICTKTTTPKGSYNPRIDSLYDPTKPGKSTSFVLNVLSTYYISVSASPSSIQPNQISTITASTNPSSQGVSISCSVTSGLGTISGSPCITGANGECSVTYNAPGSETTATITCSCPGWESGSTTVIVSSTCTRQNPLVQISPYSQSGNPGETLTYTVSVTNNDNQACGSSVFTLSVQQCPSGFSCSLDSNSLTISPGSTGSTQIEVTSSPLSSPGTYSFKVRATNSVAPNYYGEGIADYDVSTQPCTCTPWSSQGCGLDLCAPNQMHQTRTCTPSGCNAESRCVADPSCGACTGCCDGTLPNCVPNNLKCNDNNACTIDICNPDCSCSYTDVTSCINNDGCCPVGCNANSDNDCSPSCGNDVVEGGEECELPGTNPPTNPYSSCPSDGWYCVGNINEQRDYYCGPGCSCTYYVTDSVDCNSLDGWWTVNIRSCCQPGTENACTCRDEEYRDYYCSQGSCSYNVVSTRTLYYGCTDCNSFDTECADYYCSQGSCNVNNMPCGYSCSNGICDGYGGCYPGGCNLDCEVPSPPPNYKREITGSCGRTNAYRAGSDRVCNLYQCVQSSRSNRITGGWNSISLPKGNFKVGEIINITVNGIWTAVNGVRNNNWKPLLECRLTKIDKDGNEMGGIEFDHWGTGDKTFSYKIKPNCDVCTGCTDCKMGREGKHCEKCIGGAAGCTEGCDSSGIWRIDYCLLVSDFYINDGWNLITSGGSTFNVSTELIIR